MKNAYSNVFFLAVLSLLGCEHVNSNYCEGAPHTNCKDLVDAPIDGPPTGCKAMPSLCTGATPACDMVADKCVECTVASHDLCTGVEPVCGTDQACRGCTAHSECASEVCLPDGSCAAEGDVAYVSGAGSGTACTKAAPCKTLTAAVTASKATVKITGVTAEPASVTVGAVVRRVFGDAGAQITTATVAPIVLASANTNVEFHQVTIGNEPGIQPPACILINNGTTATIKVFGGKIYGCQVGISNASSGGTVIVSGATITGNKGGGISVANGSFKLTNNVIAENGDASAGGSTFGGVSLTSTANDNVFEQNTVVFNHSLIGNPGASCSAVAAFHGRRNIITSNNLGLTFPASQSVGCADIESYTAAGTSANDLRFAAIAPAPINFHLTAASPATVRDVAGLTTCTGGDIDGDARPINTLCDLGADEYKP